MFDFLNPMLEPEEKCSVCSASSKDTIIVGFDPTNRGEFENGRKENLCLVHLKDKWLDYVKKYKGTAICFLPFKGQNSYSYVTLNRANEFCIKEEMIKKLEELIRQESHNINCSKCSEKANFILFGYTYNENKIKTEKLEHAKLLCGRHFIDEIIREIELNNMKIDEINTPFGDEGIYMEGGF